MFSSTSGLFGLTANVLSALLPLLIFIFVARATPADSLFFYHPISMAFAFLLLMPQGVLVLTSNTHFFKFLLGESNRRAKVSIHFWTQIVALVLLTAGFIAIFANKLKNGKVHFSTWHSWFGFLSLVLCWLQVVGGLYLDSAWPKTMLRRIWANPPPDLTVKKLHRIAGISGFSLGIFTVVLATYSNFATSSMPTQINLTILIFSMLLGIVVIPLGLRMNLPAVLQ